MNEKDYQNAVITNDDELKNLKERIARTTAKEYFGLGFMFGMLVMAVLFAILSNYK